MDAKKVSRTILKLLAEILVVFLIKLGKRFQIVGPSMKKEFSNTGSDHLFLGILGNAMTHPFF